MSAVIGVLLLVAAVEEPPADCSRAQTMKDVRLCMDEARHVEIEMQDTYYDLLQKLGSNGRGQEYKTLEEGQRAWQTERKESCNKASEHWGNGSIRDAHYIACMMERAEKRTAELRGEPAAPQAQPAGSQPPVPQPDATTPASPPR
jgi:uncharacterized protein YecT (DUF1311 family)